MRFEIVVVGASLGGFQALQVILAELPAGFRLPIVVAQHRVVAAGFGMSTFLQRRSRLPVLEADDKQSLLGGGVYIAPADYHLLVEPGALALSTEAAVSYARPSIDVLFASAADAYGTSAIAVVLTGASHDGAAGAARIKGRGGVLIVQDPADAECAVMPQAALAAAAADDVLPLARIAGRLAELAEVPR